MIMIRLLVLVGLAVFSAGEQVSAIFDTDSKDVTLEGKIGSRFVLSGLAWGGTLGLGSALDTCRSYGAQTKKGDAPELVASRIAEALNVGFAREGLAASSADSSLIIHFGFEGSWFSYGTEQGFIIPPAPQCLSAKYDETKNEALLEWQMQSTSYDCAALSYRQFTEEVFNFRGKGQSVSQKLKVHVAYAPALGSFIVVGLKDRIPSSPVAIHLERRSQEELFAIPFWQGIAPNWVPWNMEGEAGILCQQGEREIEDNKSTRIDPPEHGRFYQRLVGKSKNAVGGTWRHFLGLTAGHTYKLHVKVNTFDAVAAPSGNSNMDNWSFSIHATPNKSPAMSGLSVNQYVGKDPLPNGEAGKHAGELAAFSSKATTNGKWIEVATGSPQLPDIKIPEGYDSITVWLRVSGQIPTGVGMDWIKLEDVTDKPQS